MKKEKFEGSQQTKNQVTHKKTPIVISTIAVIIAVLAIGVFAIQFPYPTTEDSYHTETFSKQETYIVPEQKQVIEYETRYETECHTEQREETYFEEIDVPNEYQDRECESIELRFSKQETSECDDGTGLFDNTASHSCTVSNLDTKESGTFTIEIGFKVGGNKISDTKYISIDSQETRTVDYEADVEADKNSCFCKVTPPTKQECEWVDKLEWVTEKQEKTRYVPEQVCEQVEKQIPVTRTLYEEVEKIRIVKGTKKVPSTNTITAHATLFDQWFSKDDSVKECFGYSVNDGSWSPLYFLCDTDLDCALGYEDKSEKMEFKCLETDFVQIPQNSWLNDLGISTQCKTVNDCKNQFINMDWGSISSQDMYYIRGVADNIFKCEENTCMITQGAALEHIIFR